MCLRAGPGFRRMLPLAHGSAGAPSSLAGATLEHVGLMCAAGRHEMRAQDKDAERVEAQSGQERMHPIQPSSPLC